MFFCKRIFKTELNSSVRHDFCPFLSNLFPHVGFELRGCCTCWSGFCTLNFACVPTFFRKFCLRWTWKPTKISVLSSVLSAWPQTTWFCTGLSTRFCFISLFLSAKIFVHEKLESQIWPIWPKLLNYRSLHGSKLPELAQVRDCCTLWYDDSSMFFCKRIKPS